MPKVIITEKAQREFDSLDGSQTKIFAKHLAKLGDSPPKKRLKGTNSYLVEEAGQGRIICAEDGGTLLILHIFPTHKEYEKWFTGQK